MSEIMNRVFDWALSINEQAAENTIQEAIDKILSMTNQEMINEMIAEGKDPDEEATRVRDIFKRAMERTRGE